MYPAGAPCPDAWPNDSADLVDSWYRPYGCCCCSGNLERRQNSQGEGRNQAENGEKITNRGKGKKAGPAEFGGSLTTLAMRRAETLAADTPGDEAAGSVWITRTSAPLRARWRADPAISEPRTKLQRHRRLLSCHALCQPVVLSTPASLIFQSIHNRPSPKGRPEP